MVIGTVLLGIVIVVIGVVEWLVKTFTVIHAVAILTIIVGLWVALSGYGSYYTGRGGRGGV
jgi:hypothetical protein